MARNGRQRPPRPRIEIAQSSASPEEAAAIAAGIEQFLRDSAPSAPAIEPAMSPWLRAGLFENAGLHEGEPGPWGDPEPWGRS